VQLKDFGMKPWYERSRKLKLISLIPYVWQIVWLSRQFKYFVFFADTGILERTAIGILNRLGCRTIVLQDAMKRKPVFGKPRSLTWFGGGGAHLYLIMGERYLSMLSGKRSEVVGSPIYQNKVTPLPLGKNILLVNQCFARYGESTEIEEFEFIKEVVQAAEKYGPIELRLHPHNNATRYYDLKSSKIQVTQQGPVKKSIENAGIVLAINSTVILEALTSGRPVLTLDWHPSPFEQPIRQGITRCASLNDMSNVLQDWNKTKRDAMVPPVEILQKEVESFIAYTGQASKLRIAAAMERFAAEI
jgi:hypothetical protein